VTRGAGIVAGAIGGAVAALFGAHTEQAKRNRPKVSQGAVRRAGGGSA
jgi:gas vesicle protein